VRTTNGTHLQPGKWVARLVEEIQREGRTTGRLFQRALEPPQLCEFADDFYTVLEGVQSATVGLIAEDFDVREEAGILRSCRPGLTDHARNMQIPRDLIEAFNRWHEVLNSSTIGHSMIDRYSTIESLKPTYLRFSHQL